MPTPRIDRSARARARAARARAAAAHLGGRRRASGRGGRGGRAARGAARGAGDPHLLRQRAVPPGHPCLVESSPHVPEAGALWDEADVVVAIGSDLDGMMTQGWKQPQPPHLVAINVDAARRVQELPAGRACVEADAREGDRRAGGAARRPRRARLAPAPGPRAEPRGARAARRARTGGRGFLDALDGRAARRRGRGVRHVHPRLLARRLPPHARRRGSSTYPLGWGTLGCAFPQGLGAALAGRGPAVSISGDGGFLYAVRRAGRRRRRSNIPLTAVIVDDGGYGMIRYDQDLHGDPREGVDLANARLRRARRARSGSARTAWTASASTSGRAQGTRGA